MTERASKGRASGSAPPSVVVVTPTRGLVHSRTVQSVLAALDHAEKAGLVRRVEDWWQWSHGRPIPEAHETVTELGMATGADLLWMIEDDNVVPPTALAESVRTMERTKAGIVPVVYPVGTRGLRWNSIQVEDGEIQFCGLGITLISRQTFEKMPRPWFSLDRWYGRVPNGKGTKLALIDRPFPPNQGGVDVAFCLRAREAGAKIIAVPRNERTDKPLTGAQLRITKQGAASGSGINSKPHGVEVWDTIDAEQRGFQAQDRDRFDSRARDREITRGIAALAPWVTGFWSGSGFYGGKYDAMHDPRVTLARDQFPEANSVLELGSLEGGHTLAISRWADHVVGVEGRDANIRKAEFILRMYEVTNAKIVNGNLETMRLADLGTFDLVYSVGVLYHMPEPLKLIAQCADAAPDLFLWTHHSGTDKPRVYQEGRDPLSGLSPTSIWLPRSELLAELRDRYRTVEVLDEEETAAGPAITIAARGV